VGGVESVTVATECRGTMRGEGMAGGMDDAPVGVGVSVGAAAGPVLVCVVVAAESVGSVFSSLFVCGGGADWVLLVSGSHQFSSSGA